MRTTLKLTALAFFLMVNGAASANENSAQHAADCVVKSSLAKNIMENRLNGTSRADAERGRDPDSKDKAELVLNDVIEQTYTYDISNGSVENFQEKVHQECMAEG
tara:strand:- start:1532 stop:1846 length:315 start_codon:yes stop_codon:yes gene_type:complete